MNGKSCCTPQRGTAKTFKPQAKLSENKNAALDFNTVRIEGGEGFHGTNAPVITGDEESPCRKTEITSFQIMRTTVTNSMFRTFVKETGYKTEAERFGWSFVFVSEGHQQATQAAVDAPWWRRVEKANWQRHDGTNIIDAEYDDHPVVHVTWNDANAFANWAGGRLPLEREWEHAARGGQGDVVFPWGDQTPDDADFMPCNIWQGDFPEHNTCRDGFASTAPADAFEPNGYGLYNMCGNVWEWTAQSYKVRSLESAAREHKKRMRGTKVLKGGSFLCHRSYCFRYRIAARTGNTPDSSAAHQGFRLVFD